jgi:uncharacterized RDD family membrane protein YckC
MLNQNNQTSLLKRIFAKFIDFCVLIFFDTVFPKVLGTLIGLLYFLLKDSFFSGQSLGKKVMHLKVVSSEDLTKSCTFKQSVLRNSLFSFLFFTLIPFWGWILVFLLGFPICLIELYLMRTRPNGIRIGDLFAETIVVDFKHKSS